MIPQTARPPSKPGRPVAAFLRGVVVYVKWTQPEDDGGAAITAYHIKYGKRITRIFPNYDTVNVTGNATFFAFTDQLNRNTTYHFSVAAENTAGQGEFSDISDYVSTDVGK